MQLEEAEDVGIEFARSDKGEVWSLSDFTVPVLKLEPRAVTLLFMNNDVDSKVLRHLPEAIKAGTRIRVIRCERDRICPWSRNLIFCISGLESTMSIS